MRLDFIKGYFDVREYNAKKTRAERTIKGNDTTITFDVTFAADQLPAELTKYAKAKEKDGVTRYAVKFKISSNVVSNTLVRRPMPSKRKKPKVFPSEKSTLMKKKNLLPITES